MSNLNRINAFSAVAAGLVLLAALAVGPEAEGSVNLKQVQVSRGDQVDLLFDRELKPSDIKTEYFRDIIQISVRNASVYPAKIVSVKGDNVSKVFAYQYTPNLVRCRLTVKGDAARFDGKLKLDVDGRRVTLKVDGARAVRDEIATGSAAPVRAAGSGDSGLSEPEKSRLLDKVMAGTREEGAKPAGKTAAAKPSGSAPAQASAGTIAVLGGRKPGPSPMGAFWWLTVMIGALGALAYGLKKVKGGAGAGMIARLGLSGPLKALAAKKDFEIVSSHHLGPRRSIMLVRVKNRLLVLGVSNEAINLITEFDDAGGADAAEQAMASIVRQSEAPRPAPAAKPAAPAKGSLSARIAAQMARDAARGDAKAAEIAADMGTGAEAAGPSHFADFLSQEEARPASAGAGAVSVNRFSVPREASGSGSGVRESIRKRVEGLKSL